MTTELFATVDGRRVVGLRAYVPNVGAWFADCDLDTKADLVGRVELTIGPLVMRGTVAPAYSGSFGLATKLRVVAGAGGWAKSIAPKHYHNDAGVKASTILTDAARSAGESIRPPASLDRVGNDFVRSAGPASRVLEQVLGTIPWWVDYAGITQIGERTASEALGPYELVNFDQRTQIATLAAEDPGAVQIGTVLRTRLDAPATVRELEIVMGGGQVRLYAWCGGESSAHGRLGRGLRAIARQESIRHDLKGLYRYRVVNMNGERVELQAVRKLAGLPDVLPVSLAPGMAGLWAELTPGSLVLVSFIEGDASAPLVTHYAPKDGPGFLPVSLLLDATEALNIGPSVASVVVASGILAAARMTDPVQAGPFTGVITAGSPKVKVG